jgi:type IV pilus assembly protein PilE
MANTGIRQRGRNAGFTLIELMIVVVIVGILTLIAVPMYENQVMRTYRTTAQSDLIGFAQAMEKEYALTFSYTGAVAGQTYPDESPLDSDEKRYDLQIIAAELSTTTFTLRAVPKNAQSGDGALYIDHLGRRKWDRDNDGDPNEPGELSWELH